MTEKGGKDFFVGYFMAFKYLVQGWESFLAEGLDYGPQIFCRPGNRSTQYFVKYFFNKWKRTMCIMNAITCHIHATWCCLF
jgi:hypothetical protein